MFESDTSRAVYLDGGSKGTDATDVDFNAAVSTTSIWAASNCGAFEGYIAEPAIWNVALTDAEVAILAKGFSPLLVRPQALVSHPQMIRPFQDLFIGAGWSETG